MPDEILRFVIVEGGEAMGLSSAMPPSHNASRPEIIDALAAIVRGFGK